MVYQFILIFLLIISVLALLWFIPFDIQVYYRKEWQTHKVSAVFRLLGGRAGLTWGPYVFQWEIKDLFVSQSSTKLMEANLANWKDRWHELHRFRNLPETLREIADNFRLKEWRWYTEVGFKDPALTALAVGALWALKGWLWGVLHSRVKVEVDTRQNPQPLFGVHPSFERPGLRIDFFCRLEATTGRMAVPLIRYYFNSRKINPVDTLRKNWRAFRANYL